MTKSYYSLRKELLARYTTEEIKNSLELIAQQNMESFPDSGNVSELKRQQFILEHFRYFINSMPEAKDNL